jgi:Uma2 family endonuclease
MNVGEKTAIPARVYLHTSFPDTDREYREGDLVEGTEPDYLHGRTQLLLGIFFEALRRKLSVYACTETRMKLREDLYLIPDIAVFWPSEPALLPDSPPLVAIEVLSPDDRLTAVREKLQEYRTWGVPHVWLVDPHSRRLYICDTGLREVSSFDERPGEPRHPSRRCTAARRECRDVWRSSYLSQSRLPSIRV